MAISLSDIEFFLSGGPTNSSPNNSLGGQPSSFLVLGSMNNLFSDVSSENADSGRTDYRCFYIFNTNTADTLYDAKIFIGEQGPGGSSVAVGVGNSTEIQRINIVGPVYFGNLLMRYDSAEFTAAWGSSAGEFETNLQSELGSIAPGVSVSSLVQGNNYQFTISFFGDSDKRSHPLLEVVNNGLLAPDAPIVSVSRIASGSPINSIAPTIPVDTAPPANVSFYNADESSKLSIGTLNPGDGVPVWIKRTTQPNTEYMEADYFKLKISGRPF